MRVRRRTLLGLAIAPSLPVRRRTLLGFAIAPSLPVIGLVLFFAMNLEPLLSKRDTTALSLLGGVAFYLAISYAYSLLIGIPTLLLFSKIGLRSAFFYVAAGAIGGVLPIAIVAVADAIQTLTIDDPLYRAYRWEHWWSIYPEPSLIAAAAGAVVAGAFWLIARPDRHVSSARSQPA